MTTRRITTHQLQPVSIVGVPPSIVIDEVSLPSNYQEPLWGKDIIAEWRRRKDLLKAGAYPTQSVLVRGPSGAGKSTAARWIAKELRLPMYVMSIASTIESFMGSTGRNLDAALRWAWGTPSVLLLDEVDSVAASRLAKHSDVGEIWRISNSFIQSLDGWHSMPRESLLIATTNMMDGSIDGAIERRFEMQVVVRMPDVTELSRIAGVPWPDGYIVTQAECARMVLMAKRQSVMRDMDYAMTLMALVSSECPSEEMPF